MPSLLPSFDQLVFGPYRPPRFRLGGTLRCRVYGSRPVVGVSAARISWPLVRAGTRRRAVPALVGGLVRAVRLEARQAVAAWWGVSDSTVTKWWKALGVPEHNPGTARLRRVAADALLHTRPPGRRWRRRPGTRPGRRPRSPASGGSGGPRR
jgi:hypothetical protein